MIKTFPTTKIVGFMLLVVLVLPLWWSWGLEALPLSVAQCQSLSEAAIKGAWTNIRFGDASLLMSPTYKTHIELIWHIWQWYEPLVHTYHGDPSTFNSLQASQEFCDLVNKVHASYFEAYANAHDHIRIKRGYAALYHYLTQGIKILSPDLHDVIIMHVHAEDTLQLVVKVKQ